MDSKQFQQPVAFHEVVSGGGGIAELPVMFPVKTYDFACILDFSDYLIQKNDTEKSPDNNLVSTQFILA